jgi:hypothetical protein
MRRQPRRPPRAAVAVVRCRLLLNVRRVRRSANLRRLRSRTVRAWQRCQRCTTRHVSAHHSAAYLCHIQTVDIDARGPQRRREPRAKAAGLRAAAVQAGTRSPFMCAHVTVCMRGCDSDSDNDTHPRAAVTCAATATLVACTM